MKTQHLFFMAFVVSALLLIGCSKAEQTTNRSETAAPPPAAAPTTSTATASAGELNTGMRRFSKRALSMRPRQSTGGSEQHLKLDSHVEENLEAQASDPKQKQHCCCMQVFPGRREEFDESLRLHVLKRSSVSGL